MTFVEAAVAAEAKHGTLVSVGSYKPPADIRGKFKGAGVGPSPAYSYQACVAEVTVDLDTGEVKIDKLTLAHDCGRALNPVSVEGQIEGGAYMGAGEALMEEQGFRAWMHKKPSLLDYKIPTSLDTPPIQAIVIETIDAEGPVRREGSRRRAAQPGGAGDCQRRLRRDRRAHRRNTDHAGEDSARARQAAWTAGDGSHRP